MIKVLNNGRVLRGFAVIKYNHIVKKAVKLNKKAEKLNKRLIKCNERFVEQCVKYVCTYPGHNPEMEEALCNRIKEVM